MRWRFSCQFAIITNMLFDRAGMQQNQALKKQLRRHTKASDTSLANLKRDEVLFDGLEFSLSLSLSNNLSNPSREDPMKNNLNSFP